jgi:hypothetical protein
LLHDTTVQQEILPQRGLESSSAADPSEGLGRLWTRGLHLREEPGIEEFF